MSINADLYIVFRDKEHDCAGGVHDSLGVFDSLEAAQDFYEHGDVKGDWWEHRYFDTLAEADSYLETRRAKGEYGWTELTFSEKSQCTMYHERGTPAQIYCEDSYIATVGEGRLVICSKYCLVSDNPRTYEWEEVSREISQW